MRHRWLFVFVSLLVLAHGSARAKVLELWVQVQGGGLYGLYGTEKFDPATDVSPATDDFFRSHSGAGFGVQVGIELFFVDVVVDFLQLADGNGLSGTLTCFLLGYDWDFELGDRWVLTPFGLVGFGLATYDNSWLEKEYPQISKADLQARAALLRLGTRLEFKLHELFRVGLEGGIGYHYVLQTDKAANDLEGHSHGFHVYGMGILRFQWEPFAQKERGEPAESQPEPASRPAPREPVQPQPVTQEPATGAAARPRPAAAPATSDATGAPAGE